MGRSLRDWTSRSDRANIAVFECRSSRLPISSSVHMVQGKVLGARLSEILSTRRMAFYLLSFRHCNEIAFIAENRQEDPFPFGMSSGNLRV